MSSGEVIKNLRIHILCMEQEEFANAIGVSPASISIYEGGDRIPRLSTIREMRRLASLHGVEIPVKDFLEKKEGKK